MNLKTRFCRFKGVMSFWNNIARWLVFFGLTVLRLQGQTVSVSEPLDMRNVNAYFIVGELAETYQVVREIGNLHYMDIYDQKLQLIRSQEFSVTDKPFTIIHCFGYKNHTYIASRYRDKKISHVLLSKYTGYGELVDTITVFAEEDFLSLGASRVDRSRFGSKLLASHINKTDELAVHVIDLDSFESLYDDVLEFEDISLPGGIVDMMVDDEGATVIVTDENRATLSRNDFELSLFRLTIEDNTLISYYNTLAIEDRWLTDVSFTMDYRDGGVYLTGFGSLRRAGRGDFTYVGKLTPELELEFYEEYPFEPSVLRSIYGDQKKVRENIQGLAFRDLILLEDGSILILSEIVKTFSRRSGLGGNPVGGFIGGGWVDYYYEDVVALCLNPDRDLEWSEVLHKKQFSQDDGGIYSSYFLMENPSSIRLVYNDDIRNDNTISEYILSPDGYFERNSLFNTDTESLLLRFREGVQVSASEYLIPSEAAGFLSLVSMKY